MRTPQHFAPTNDADLDRLSATTEKGNKMTLMLELSPDTEARLQRKAERAEQSLPEYLIAVADAVSEEEDTETLEGSAYDLFADRIGLFRSSGEGKWSEDTGRKFAEGMAEKRRQGYLQERNVNGENAMTVTLELPTEIEAQVATEAAQKGMPLPDYPLAIIQERRCKPSEGIETYLLSESALAKDWLRPEEDDVWRDL